MSFRKSEPQAIYLPRHGTLDDCLEMGKLAYRFVNIDSSRAEEECRTMLSAPFAASAVVDRHLGSGEVILAGVINAVLLTPEFSNQILEAREPYFHNQVRQSRIPPFPTSEQIVKANSAEGLDLFLGHFSVDVELENNDSIYACSTLVRYFSEHFAGQHLKSLLVETVGWESTMMARNSGFEVVSTYLKWRTENDIIERDGPHLMRITLDRAIEVQNYHMVRLLQHRPPTFRFAIGAQEVLRYALRGFSDKEIASMPGFSETSVASHWTRILQKARTEMPHLFISRGGAGKSQDRLSLLNYLRNHPEEIWPH